jgi:Phosphodiester glycosidase
MKIHRYFVFLIILLNSVSIFAQDFKTVEDGIEYAEVTRGTKEEPVRVNLLKLDLKKVRLDVVHALDAAIGLEKTSSIASRHGAFAAINAGFFKMSGLYSGDAAGVLLIDNWRFSESYAGRVALFIANTNEKTDVFIERANISTFLIVGKNQIDVGENRECLKDDAVIYTKIFHRTTLTDNSVVEFVVRNEKVKEIFDGKGSNEIPTDGYVLSAKGKKREELIKLLRIGSKLRMRTRVSSPVSQFPSPSYGISEDIVGGVPQLIKNNKIAITWQEEKIGKEFVETRHPRTAVAKLKDGKFLMVTVDGRQAGFSVGMNLNELAEFLLELGATDAMNLDGGGSTTMFLDGKIVNKPSDKEGERSVSDAILVTLRNKK